MIDALRTSARRTRGRIAILAPSAYTLGGVQTWLDYLVPGLTDKGWIVHVLLVDGVHSRADEYLRAHPLPDVICVANPTGSREGRIRALSGCIATVDPDLVLVVNIVDAYEAVRRLRKKTPSGPKIAMALHGLNACFQQDIQRWHALLDGVIATNQLAVQAAVEFGGMPASRTHYSPCGVEIGSEPEPICPNETLELVFVGRFDNTEKRVLDLQPILTALERENVPFRLRLAGAGPAETDLRDALESFGDKVQFLGSLDAETLRKNLFAPKNIILILSHSETGPLVAWEAMVGGAVVVTSQFVGIGLEGGLCDGRTCLTFPIGDSERAAQAIGQLRDTRLRMSLSTAGWQLVCGRYSRASSIRAWDEALSSTLLEPVRDEVVIPAENELQFGRLDKLVGSILAEEVRHLFNIRFEHSEPGGEWPHSYGLDGSPEFRLALENLDARDATPVLPSFDFGGALQ